MPEIKIERFWPNDIRDIATRLSEAIIVKDFQLANTQLSLLLDILKDTSREGKARVSICFIIDQLKFIDPFIEPIVNSLINVLNSETDSHVKEFSVWALGRIVEESQSIELIKQTMPIFVGFCNDQSDHVKTFAEDIKERLNSFLEEKINLDEKIQKALEKLDKTIQDRVNEMNERAKILSKEALDLDYKAAFERRTEMEDKIRKFKDLNAESEDEILAVEEQLIKEIPALKGESRNSINKWREIRGEKEALIRRVHCILRIQSKIYRIISHITNQKDGKIDLKVLKEETEYSDKDIVEILKKLVDEEIIPNFMKEQIEQIKFNVIDEKDKKTKSDQSLATDSSSEKKLNGLVSDSKPLDAVKKTTKEDLIQKESQLADQKLGKQKRSKITKKSK
jgi:hypothetical protein